MSTVDTYLYAAPVKPLRDWLRLQSGAVAAIVGGPSATTARIFAMGPDEDPRQAGLLPGGADPPAIAFHDTPGAIFDNTTYTAAIQWDCYGTTAVEAAQLAAALASLLASTPPRTRLATGIIFEGPGVIVDSFYLPVRTNRIARQILRTRLAFQAF